MNIAEEDNNSIRFLYRIREGKADKSYGIHVAQLAGIPEDVIIRAQQILEDLESGNKDKEDIKFLENMVKAESENDEIIKKLDSIDIANITPLQALMILNELKSSIKYKKVLTYRVFIV